MWNRNVGVGRVAAGMVGVAGLAIAVAVGTASAGGEKCRAAMEAARANAANVALASPSVLSAEGSEMYGPPMVCHEVIIGKNPSLPWDGGRGGSDSKYDVSKLPADAVELLKKEKSPLVRMETLRRAAVYMSYQGEAHGGRAGRGEALAWELIGRRAGYVMFGEASRKKDPLAWFDVAYFIGCLNQVEMGKGFEIAEADGVPGYLFMKQAIAMASELKYDEKTLAEMELGAAIMTHPAMRHMEWKYAIGTKDDIYDRHMLAAVRGSAGDELLEMNIAAHLKTFGGSIDGLRKVSSAK